MQREESAKPKNQSATLEQRQESVYSIKVSNLPKNVVEKELFETFRKCGWIKSIKIICGNPLNYAYVNFLTLEAAKTACDKLQNSFIGGKKIYLKLKSTENVETPVTLFSFDSTKRKGNMVVVGEKEIHPRRSNTTSRPSARKLGNNTSRSERTDNSEALDSIEPDEPVTTTDVQLEKVYHSVSISNEFSLLQKDIKEEFDVTVVLSAKLLEKHTIKISGGNPITVEILEGNIVYEQADVIVNPANERLNHAGGLAKEIVKVGGDSIQLESTAYVKQYGQLLLSEAVCLGAGDLLCKHIIHVVGPRWNGGRNGEEESLYLAVYNVLISANKIQAQTIALPALGTGIFGVPEDVCAAATWKAINHFCKTAQTSHLHTIRCVLNLPRVVRAFLSCGKDGNSLPSSDNLFPLYTWKWEENNSFNDYPTDVCKKLSKKYAENLKGSVTLHINGKTYLMNFSDMTQTNTSTLYKRKVQQIPVKAVNDNISNVHWLFKNDNNNFTPYTQSDSNTIEAMFQSKTSKVVTICERKYSFDFERMCQINVHTNTARPIQRKEEDLKPLDLSLNATSPVENTPLLVKLIGPQSRLSKAESLLKQKLKEMFKKDEINVSYNLLSHLLSKIKHICNENKVIYSFKKDSTFDSMKYIINLEGSTSNVVSGKAAILGEIVAYHESMPRESTFNVPPHWDTQQNKTTALIPLDSKSSEYSRVEQKFHSTIMGKKITTVFRIQNLWLWQKYCQHKELLEMKNINSVGEKLLFHGTRNNEPKRIYDNEEGFDMRFSAKGMWGNANYFAENASYSDAYAYKNSSGAKEIFLALVLTGDSIRLSPDSNLRMPPPKSSNVIAEGKVQFAETRYDTVNGFTQNSTVYMTYDNLKAYPTYLISYM